MKKYCFGADIGGTTVKLGLFDADGMSWINGRFRPIQKMGEQLSCRIWQRLC